MGWPSDSRIATPSVRVAIRLSSGCVVVRCPFSLSSVPESPEEGQPPSSSPTLGPSQPRRLRLFLASSEKGGPRSPLGTPLDSGGAWKAPRRAPRKASCCKIRFVAVA